MDLLITSDWHETPFTEKKFETQKESWGEKIIQVLGSTGKSEVMDKMKEIIKLFGIKHVINNGDLQENSKNEQGIVSDEDLDSAKKIISDFEKRNKVQMHLNAGNHELGYHKTKQPLATDPEGGISFASAVKFLRLVEKNQLYQSFVLGGYRIVFIPYMMTEDFSLSCNMFAEKEHILDELTIDLHGSEKVILFIHDPDSLMNERLVNLIRVFKPYIPLIFCGHYHAQLTLTAVKWLISVCNWKVLAPVRWMLRLILNIAFDSEISRAVQESYRERKKVPKLMEEFDIQIIPAPGGMLGFGGGFLVLDTETLEITKF